ncbi:hypothetical protein ACQ4PT_052888 [Festuca glaucescens]
MDNGSPVRTGVGDCDGDFQNQNQDLAGGASRSPPGEAARGTASAPGRLPARCGGRFWARKGGSAEEGLLDGDESSSGEEEVSSSEASSPRRPSDRPTFGGFLERALASGVGGGRRRPRRRSSFAPGGRPSRFGGFASPIRGLGASRWADGQRGCHNELTRESPPTAEVQRPLTPAGVEAAGRRRPEQAVPEATVSLLDLASAWLGPRVAPNDGPWGESGPETLDQPFLRLGPPLGSGDRGRELSAASGPTVVGAGWAQAQPVRWLWLPKGCKDPELGFPARSSERKRRGVPLPFRTLFRIPDPLPLSRSFAEVVAMAGGGGGGGGGSGGNGGGHGDGRKRRHDEQGGGRFGYNNNSGFNEGYGGGRADGGGRSDGGSRSDYYGGRADGGGRSDHDNYGGGRQGYGGGRYHDGGGHDGFSNNPNGRRDGGRQGEERRGQQQDEPRPRQAEGQRGRGQQGAARGGGAQGGKLKGVAQGAPPQPKAKGKAKDDVKLMHQMGLDAYRFSIAWPRLIPDGRGAINPKGLEYYNNLIDELILHGIQPHVTLYHFDLPQSLQDEYNGLLSPRFIDDYTKYADVCFENFGDRVKHWVTVNEPNIKTLGGFDSGTLPPRRCSVPFGANCAGGDSTKEPYVAAHHLLLAHASAVSLYRHKYQANQRGHIGITLLTGWYAPATNESQDAVAATRMNDFHIGWFMHPLVYGDYPPVMRTRVGARLPDVTAEQSKKLSGSFDFIGLNHYAVFRARADENAFNLKQMDYFADGGIAGKQLLVKATVLVSYLQSNSPLLILCNAWIQIQ